MNTDQRPDLRRGGESKLVLKAETERMIGLTDPKVIDRITDHERGKMLNYLRVTKLRVGLILNFKHARLERERIVL